VWCPEVSSAALYSRVVHRDSQSRLTGESHAGQTFCCVGMLAILNALDLIDAELLGWWLAERQVKEGRTETADRRSLPDCATRGGCSRVLAMLGKLEWINKQLLTDWILSVSG
jgi:geranylgeranyl transferase type-2 subunit beta